jgi:hypothetical protein
VFDIGKGLAVTPSLAAAIKGQVQTEASKEALRQLIGTPMAVFNCPSRRSAVAYPHDGGRYENSPRPAVAGRSDYAGNTGAESFCEDHGGPVGAAYTIADGYTGWLDDKIATGVTFQRSEIGLNRITDGTSNTLFAGEKLMDSNHYADGEESGDNESLYSGYNNDNFRTAINPPLQDAPGLNDSCRFGSAHGAGMNGVYCDGSVHFIAYGVDEEMFSRLGSRRDGLPVELP